MGRWVDTFMGREPEIETRAESSYTDTLVDLMVARAGGSVAKATATAALESVAGLVGRAFATVRVDAPDPIAKALCPRTRNLIGRALVRQGESVHGLDVRGERIALPPAADWDISGSYDPDSWLYSLNLAGPSTQTRRERQGPGRVCHFVWQTEPDRPWRGVSPIEAATMAGRLSAELVHALGDEVSGTRGALLPIPVDGEDPTVTKLKADLKVLAGKLAVVESQSTGKWSQEMGRNPSDGGWRPHRVGAHPPESLVRLFEASTREIMAAVGFSPILLGLVTGDASATREAWRLAVITVLQPVGELMAEELSAKTGAAVSLDWSPVRSSDELVGRARVFASLLGSGGEGMDADQAAEVAGLQP